MRHINDVEWTKFCKGHLKVFETKWNKKLEDYVVPADPGTSSESSEESGDDHNDEPAEPAEQ